MVERFEGGPLFGPLMVAAFPVWFELKSTDIATRVSVPAHRTFYSKSNLDLNFIFPIDLAPIKISIGVKFIV